MATLLLKDKIKESMAFLESAAPFQPRVAIVLGSGMGRLADEVDEPTIIPTASIPHYPQSTVPGHKGRWVLAHLDGVPVLFIQGRVHYYEGYSLQQVTYYVHLLAALKVPTLILTTACGGLNPDFTPGDLMLITDQLNFAWNNPLIGRPDNMLGPRFPDMSNPFDPELIKLAEKQAERLNIPLQKGVFTWVTGPNYETAAEVRMLHKLGGDAVSMSTAPEVIVAVQRHLQVMGISLITNQGTGLSSDVLDHADVTRMANTSGLLLQQLLRRVIADLPELETNAKK